MLGKLLGALDRVVWAVAGGCEGPAAHGTGCLVLRTPRKAGIGNNSILQYEGRNDSKAAKCHSHSEQTTCLQ